MYSVIIQYTGGLLQAAMNCKEVGLPSCICKKVVVACFKPSVKVKSKLFFFFFFN